VATWISQSVSGDLFVGPVFPTGQGFTQFLEPQVINEIESLKEPHKDLNLNINGYHVTMNKHDASKVFVKPV